MKTHYITRQQWEEAAAFQRKNGFWNPAMTQVSVPCGMDAYYIAAITTNRKKVTCLRCKRIGRKGKK
jgi:hypothetical protein